MPAYFLAPPPVQLGFSLLFLAWIPAVLLVNGPSHFAAYNLWCTPPPDDPLGESDQATFLPGIFHLLPNKLKLQSPFLTFTTGLFLILLQPRWPSGWSSKTHLAYQASFYLGNFALAVPSIWDLPLHYPITDSLPSGLSSNITQIHYHYYYPHKIAACHFPSSERVSFSLRHITYIFLPLLPVSPQ